MMNRRRFPYLLGALLLTLLLIWAVVPAASKDKPGKDPDKPAQQDHGKGNQGNGNQGGNQGNGNQGGDHGNKGGNAGQPEQQPALESAPTAAPSTSSQLGCQKNNTGRLDCSSLSVSGVCEGNVAVFTIVNGGEPGNGDMRAPTQYRIVQDGAVVQTGSVQLAGRQSMQITWSGGGSVTLEADQQVGHPGKSHPRVTLDCGPAESTPTPVPSATATEVAFKLAADAYCLPDGSAVFTVTNNGGDMTSAIGYIITDAANNTLYESTVMLNAGQQVSFTYPPDSGATTINVGNGVAIATIDCGPAPTSEPTAEPTDEPTTEPTVEVTPTEDVTPPVDSSLSVWSECTSDGSVIFTVTNSGGDMDAPVGYTVTDVYGTVVEEGSIQLGAGASASYQFYSGGMEYTFNVGGGLAVASGYCAAGTPPPTPEVTPTTPSLSASGMCDVSGILFTITNNGADMTEPADYIVVTADAQLVDQGSVQLASGQSQTLSYPASYGTLTLKVGDFLAFSSVQCVPPTPEPTSEPTVEPTSEPTAEVTVTPTPSPTEPLGCQKNNTGRLDCSSLQVSGVCQGGEAVFTITNMGKPGEGDMRAPTSYTIYQNGQPVQTGSVQLQGRESVQITYSGGGSITLVATQQVGHPGKSQPQATLTCSK
jgi:predicted RNA-binding protein with TRAM domain